MTITNKFGGKCGTCGCSVAGGAGTATNTTGKWIVYCRAHSATRAAVPGTRPTSPKKRITHCVGCGESLDTFQRTRGFKFCSSDCATEARMGSHWSGPTANGGWHQGSDD